MSRRHIPCSNTQVFDSKTTIKSEDTPLNLTVPSAGPVKTRLFTQGDQEVIEILSSDEEMDDTVDDDVLDMISEAERDSSSARNPRGKAD
jgi:hypothetical protein